MRMRKTFGDQNDEKPCLLHGKAASCRKGSQIDVAIFGTPCDPFSEQRNKRYADGSVCQHPLFEVTFTDAFNLLTGAQSPNACVLEQVLGFNERESRTREETPMERPGARILIINLINDLVSKTKTQGRRLQICCRKVAYRV